MWKKLLKISYFFVFVSIFVSIIVFAVKKCCEGFCVGGYVLLGYVGVDFTHGLIVGPAAYLHGYFLRDVQVIGKACEAVAQAVDAYLWKIVCFADAVDLLEHSGWGHGNNIV